MTDKANTRKQQHFIIAPHPDDEIIGCYEIINNKDNSVVIMYSGDTPQYRREEAASLLGMSRTTLWRKMKEYRL